MKAQFIFAVLLAGLTAPAIRADKVPTTSGAQPHSITDTEPAATIDLKPLRENALPPSALPGDFPDFEDAAKRAEQRRYDHQLNQIRRRYFGSMRNQDIRNAGILQLQEFTDPAAFLPMIDAFHDAKDDVIDGMISHFGSQGDAGQGALAYVAIYLDDPVLRHLAATELKSPATQSVLYMVDNALRAEDDDAANAAAEVAGLLNMQQMIPLMLMTQVRQEPPAQSRGGGLAWIAVGRQEVFVRELVPVVGNNSGAFQPVLGVVQSGVVLSVEQAAVVIYRTIVHRVLVNLTKQTGHVPVAELGYNPVLWRTWYNEQLLPRLAHQAQKQQHTKAVGDPA